MKNQERNEKCNCGSGVKYKKCCMKNDTIHSVPTPNYGSEQPMKPVELFRTTLAGTALRFVKYQNADNVVLLETQMGKPNKNGAYKWNDIKTKEVQAATILGAVELIIPEYLNNKAEVDTFTKLLQPLFVNIDDVAWFKAMKDGDFEKKGDNVLELYGYMRTDTIERNIELIKQIA
jgi:hypothetical protein